MKVRRNEAACTSFTCRLHLLICSLALGVGVRAMPAIFISHSSKDRQVSGDIKAALTRFGFEQAFLDFDKETGLDIGENWEKRLYEELTRCHAVVLVLTPAWLASKWCFAELTQARAL